MIISTIYFSHLDGNDPARTAEAVVVITVVDISDHGPVFLQSSYNASIFENLAVGTIILTVSATDDDSVCFYIMFYVNEFRN